MSRRPGARFSRRIATVAGAAAPSPPTQTIGTIAAANGYAPAWNVRADYGYSLGAGGGVSALLDLSGNARHFSQPVEVSQPLWLPSDINGQAAISGDGINDALENAYSRALIVAGTVATHVWAVLVASQDTWAANDTLWSDGGAQVYQNTTLGGMRTFCGTANSSQNNNLTGYKRIVAQFTGSVTSYLWIGSVLVNGVNVGTSVSGANTNLLAAPGGVRFYNGKFAEAAAGLGDISAGAITAIDTYCVSRYGAGTTA